MRKQTKSENLFDFENQLELRWTRGSKLNKGIWLEIEATAAYFKREELCLVVIIWRRQLSNKRFTIGKSFVPPLVDSKVNPKFYLLNVFMD